MKQLVIPSSVPATIAALETALGPHGASALDLAVPGALWRRALVDPAAEFLSRPGKALRATIVRAGWTLGGGAPGAMPERLPLAIELLHAGSLIIDDVEDGSHERRGAPALHRLVGVPLAINTGSWMYFWALAELAELVPDALPLATRTLVRCHQGQALDLATKITDLDPAYAAGVVETITRLKTGALCRLGIELGAQAAGASPELRAAVGQLGDAMGIALQMLDDLGSLTSPARRAKGVEDLRLGRATWPWAWAVEQGPFAWSRLVAQARRVEDDVTLAGALADDLGEAVAGIGRTAARATLERGFAQLVAVTGTTQAVLDLADELRRMEESYV